MQYTTVLIFGVYIKPKIIWPNNFHTFIFQEHNVASNDQDVFNLPHDCNTAVAAANANVVNVLKASSSLLGSDVLHVQGSLSHITLSYLLPVLIKDKIEKFYLLIVNLC